MTDFELYREELIKESREEGRREGEKKGEENAIIKMVQRLRKLNLDDSQILKSLNEDYGSSFSSSQLKQMLKSVD